MKISTALAIASIAMLAHHTPATAGDQNAAAQTKYKQCVMFYSPRYEKLRIKPIHLEYRWCDKANRKDCAKWSDDTLADKGYDFSFGGYCFTFHKPIVMELKYTRTFKKGRDLADATLEPQMFKIKDNLEPHPFCATKAIHRFTLKGGKVVLTSGKPRQAPSPDCVWKQGKASANTGS